MVARATVRRRLQQSPKMVIAYRSQALNRASVIRLVRAQLQLAQAQPVRYRQRLK